MNRILAAVPALALSASLFDPFGGTSLGAARWCPDWKAAWGCHVIQPAPSGQTVAFDPARVAVGGGNLTFTIKHDPWWSGAKQHTYPYRSGAVNGWGKQWYTPGWYSVKADIACTSDGQVVNWPAFWLDPYAGYSHGEIDVMEGLKGRLAWHYHYTGPDGRLRHAGGAAAGNWCGWHRFAVSWAASRLRFFYGTPDGHYTLVGEVTAAGIGQPITAGPSFPILDLNATRRRVLRRAVPPGRGDEGGVVPRRAGLTHAPGAPGAYAETQTAPDGRRRCVIEDTGCGRNRPESESLRRDSPAA